ncbi:AbrB/MazE/SpoVT family DNA-binding domain-containing protein [Paraburkholderia sp. MPAMCS5]|uniref:AbrB/MazE/SpoVT family DNA-binding domain-containing protein n=1 Tax=Paraburkholderia sp. MPAMCS5 TaxID=3112563 RepID=UPI002E195474|nr:AbrB/MazE/SpoVT family DNA-binding domain-containing protein [Paraburkholderia sp. MPAMCS5]
MAIQTVKRWGNSLAVRIPANLATEISIEEGQEVEVRRDGGVLVITRHTPVRRFSRERLIQQYREGKLQQHGEIDFGDPVGSELGGPDDPTR